MRVLLILVPAVLLAQGPRSCDTPERRQFDFWVGEWSVASGGRHIGRSIIQKELGGCLILENWYGADGDRGKSLNWYEPATGKWRQSYVGLGWNAAYTGEWRAGALRLESGSELRLTFTPGRSGQLRQHKEKFESGQWVTVYDFHYTRETAPVQELSDKAGCDSPESRQFDFWVGQWNVYGPDDTIVGTNRIEKTVNGCLIVENWKGAKGGAGKSFNYYDTTRKKWRQVWVAAPGSLDLTGEFGGGVMRYSGETAGLDGVTQEDLSFTRNPDGTIRQLWRQSPDGGNTWRVVFDGLYRSYGKTGP
jgi:hypothetical protein